MCSESSIRSSIASQSLKNVRGMAGCRCLSHNTCSTLTTRPMRCAKNSSFGCFLRAQCALATLRYQNGQFTIPLEGWLSSTCFRAAMQDDHYIGSILHCRVTHCQSIRSHRLTPCCYLVGRKAWTASVLIRQAATEFESTAAACRCFK